MSTIESPAIGRSDDRCGVPGYADGNDADAAGDELIAATGRPVQIVVCDDCGLWHVLPYPAVSR